MTDEDEIRRAWMQLNEDVKAKVRACELVAKTVQSISPDALVVQFAGDSFGTVFGLFGRTLLVVERGQNPDARHHGGQQ